MQSSNAMPFAAPDDLGWARYRGLQLPPEIASLLGVLPPSNFDSHVPRDHVPAEPSRAREFSQEASRGLPMNSNVGPVAAAHVGDAPGASVVSSAPSVPSAPRPPQQPPLMPRRRLAGSRVCSQCQRSGHTKRTCPALGLAPPDFNRNAVEVHVLAPHLSRHRSNSVTQGAMEAAGNAPSGPSDGESSNASVDSQSGSELDEDAMAGFEGAIWKREYDSALPASDSNVCPPPPPPITWSTQAQQRRQRVKFKFR
jgi:hypothetical protein